MVFSDITPEFVRDRIWRDLGHIFRLIGRYIKADPAGSIGLSIIQIGGGTIASTLAVRMHTAIAEVTDKLVARDTAGVSAIIALLGGILSAYWVLLVTQTITEYLIRIRIRNVFTPTLLDGWLTGNRFYHLERNALLDHPEQRIQEDIPLFAEMVVQYIDSAVSAFTRLFLYSATLWTIAPPLPLSIFGWQGELPGYIFFVVLTVSAVEIVVVHKVGNLTTRAELVRQRVDANFRHEMAKIRENAESIAFENGGPRERLRLADAYALIRTNWRHYTIATGLLSGVAGLPSLLTTFLPIVFASPLILAGKMTVGGLQLMSVAYMGVHQGLTILVLQYRNFAKLRSSSTRIHYLEAELGAARISGIDLASADGDMVRLEALHVAYPDGDPMLALPSQQIAPGERWLIRGRSGVGKSTLLRAIAGLWPFGSGTVAMPQDASVMFLPQRSYMPDVTLAGLLSYPRDPEAYEASAYLAILERLSLHRLRSSLYDTFRWSKILSPGEQQRVAAARALLARPQFLFLDEATSALDPKLEQQLYEALVDGLPDTAIISVAHRPSVARFHTHSLDIADRRATAGRIDAETTRSRRDSYEPDQDHD